MILTPGGVDPKRDREEIIRMRLERLAEWLVVQFELARGYR